MTIALPKNYDPTRKHPLLVFLQGGDGSAARQANVARAVTEEQDFVCVSLPYFRKTMEKPDIKLLDEDFKFEWPLYKTMLARLDQLVPNIDPQKRVIGGFSNGGHTTAGMIDNIGDEFTGYFSAYLFVEGGSKLRHFDRIKGKPLLILYGGARGRDWDGIVGQPAREAGVQVTMHKMENVGHDFPAKEYPVVRQWLRELVK
jgi:predicted peptidase